jgi:hypothetical protein
MKIKSKKRQLKKAGTALIVISGLVVVTMIGFGVYLATGRYGSSADLSNKPGGINYNPPTEEEQHSSTETKQDAINKPSGISQSGGPDSTKTSITVSLTRISQSTAGAPVNVRSFVEGTTSGKCKITFTKSGETPVTQELEIAFEATSAYCNANIAANKFNVSGDWSLSITAQKDSIISAPATQIINIKL